MKKYLHVEYTTTLPKYMGVNFRMDFASVWINKTATMDPFRDRGSYNGVTSLSGPDAADGQPRDVLRERSKCV